MKSAVERDGSQDPTLQKAIEESAKALIEQHQKAKQDKEMGEAIYESIIELSKNEMPKPPGFTYSKEEEAVLEAKAISLEVLKREKEKK